MSGGPDLGARINKARKHTGLTVAQLAGQLGVSRSLVSDIVSGKRTPSSSIAAELVTILDLDEATKKDLSELTESTYTSSALDSIVRIDRHARGSQ